MVINHWIWLSIYLSSIFVTTFCNADVIDKQYCSLLNVFDRWFMNTYPGKAFLASAFVKSPVNSASDHPKRCFYMSNAQLGSQFDLWVSMCYLVIILNQFAQLGEREKHCSACNSKLQFTVDSANLLQSSALATEPKNYLVSWFIPAYPFQVQGRLH